MSEKLYILICKKYIQIKLPDANFTKVTGDISPRFQLEFRRLPRRVVTADRERQCRSFIYAKVLDFVLLP